MSQNNALSRADTVNTRKYIKISTSKRVVSSAINDKFDEEWKKFRS